MTAVGRPLRETLEDYLALRRALGFRLKTASRLLGQFVSWLEARGASTITTEDALEWAVLPAGASPAWQAIRLAAVRGFAAYLHGTDPSVQGPPARPPRPCSCPPPGHGCCTPTSASRSASSPPRPGSPDAQRRAGRGSMTSGIPLRWLPCSAGTATAPTSPR